MSKTLNVILRVVTLGIYEPAPTDATCSPREEQRQHSDEMLAALRKIRQNTADLRGIKDETCRLNVKDFAELIGSNGNGVK